MIDGEFKELDEIKLMDLRPSRRKRARIRAEVEAYKKRRRRLMIAKAFKGIGDLMALMMFLVGFVWIAVMPLNQKGLGLFISTIGVLAFIEMRGGE